MYPTRIEIQLQTILQHAYNFISRAWVYKSEHTFSEEWHQSFREISQTLAQLDKRVSELQEQVLMTSASEGDSDPLTPFSYQRIVSDIFGEDVDLNSAVDAVRMLMDMGYDTNVKLRSFLKNSDIFDLRERFLNLRSPQMQAFTNLVSKMTLHSFWLMFGVRLEGAKEMLDNFESKDSIDVEIDTDTSPN